VADEHKFSTVKKQLLPTPPALSTPVADDTIRISSTSFASLK